MLSYTYLFLAAQPCLSVNGCVQPQHDINPIHIETQLKLLGARSQTVPSTGKTALTKVRVFDGWGIGQPTTVVIDGNSITSDPRNAQNTIDGEGGVLPPGLIGSHIHLSSLASFEKLSSYSVTTVMDMGCVSYELCSALRDQIEVTFYFGAGIGAVAPNSTHATVFVSKSLVSTPSQAPEFVANVFGNGLDYMKNEKRLQDSNTILLVSTIALF